MISLVTAAALADLCGAPPAPAATRDPDDSAAYTAVADDAAAAGDVTTAAIAYRKAIALDPDNSRATAGLAAVCARRDAAPEGTALLDAIARYRDGDPAGAHEALAAIAAARGGSATGAHFVLGLIALERHDARAAIRELELARADPEYQALATALLRLAHRDGALTAQLLVQPELDTNPQLLPDTPPVGATTGAPEADEDLLAAVTLAARPWPWLSVRNVIAWRNQRALSALDFVGENAQLVAELARGRDRLAIRDDFDYDLLDGASYLVANRIGAAYRHELRTLAVVASYSLRRRDYQRTLEEPFTGWVHAADAGAVVHLGGGVDLDARLTLGRELTADGLFANLSGGAELAVRTRSTAPIRLAASAAGSYARYDAAEPDGALRRDLALEARADAELDLGDHVIAVAGADLARNLSSIEDFRYWKIVARLGLVLAFGGP
ncbi:MAG TPA: hypothetical protein VFK02_17675 [Kofleriaceae bacterium]|nr:hypothetical protein [Kofleriaceae bacterium]